MKVEDVELEGTPINVYAATLKMEEGCSVAPHDLPELIQGALGLEHPPFRVEIIVLFVKDSQLAMDISFALHGEMVQGCITPGSSRK